MIKKIFAISMMLLLFSIPASAKNIGGANLPDTLIAGNETLVLNGAGLRTKMFVKVYVGALYLKQSSADSAKIMAADEPMIIRLHFIYDGVDSAKLVGGWNDGFKSSTGGNIEPFKTEIDAFNACFSEEAKKNDIYDLIYTPGEGVSVIAKGNLKATIKGLEFKKVLFGIWLGEKTELKSLRKEMLGQ